jgi:hypothetical protein
VDYVPEWYMEYIYKHGCVLEWDLMFCVYFPVAWTYEFDTIFVAAWMLMKMKFALWIGSFSWRSNVFPDSFCLERKMSFHEGYRSTRKIFVAEFSWLFALMKTSWRPGGIIILVEVAVTNSHHEKRSWRLTLTKISWCLIRVGTFVRVRRQRPFSWQF